MTKSDGLIEHLERFLGRIAEGWAEDGEGNRLPFQIVEFKPRKHQPVFFSTLGLSRHVLQTGAEPIRQELVMAVESRFASTEVVGILDSVGEMVLDRHAPLLRGEVLGPRGRLVTGSDLCALYVAQPVLLPDEFGEFAGPEPPPIVFPWLVPISYEEAGFINTHGSKWFEDKLLEQQPNLCDFMRPSISHG